MKQMLSSWSPRCSECHKKQNNHDVENESLYLYLPSTRPYPHRHVYLYVRRDQIRSLPRSTRTNPYYAYSALVLRKGKIGRGRRRIWGLDLAENSTAAEPHIFLGAAGSCRSLVDRYRQQKNSHLPWHDGTVQVAQNKVIKKRTQAYETFVNSPEIHAK